MKELLWFKNKKSKEEAEKVLEESFLTRSTDDSFDKEKDLSKESFLNRLDEFKKIIDKNKSILEQYDLSKDDNTKKILLEIIEEKNITPENIKKLKEEYSSLNAKYEAVYNNKDVTNFNFKKEGKIDDETENLEKEELPKESFEELYENTESDLTFEQALKEWRDYALDSELNIKKGMLPLEYISKLEEENENFRMDLAKLKKEPSLMSAQEQKDASEKIDNKIVENVNKINAVHDFLLMYGKYFEK